MTENTEHGKTSRTSDDYTTFTDDDEDLESAYKRDQMEKEEQLLVQEEEARIDAMVVDNVANNVDEKTPQYYCVRST
jgi:hypothetical protein